jgi:amino acid adenylation domain-containing protein
MTASSSLLERERSAGKDGSFNRDTLERHGSQGAERASLGAWDLVHPTLDQLSIVNRPAVLARLLADAADADADGIAIRDQGVSITWQQADRRAGCLAGALVDAGVQPGDRVGIHYRKSADAFLAMHAVVRIGAIAVPLDPTASGDYLASVITQSGCTTMLTHQACVRSALGIVSADVLTAVIGVDDPEPDVVRSVRFIGPGALDALDPRPPLSVESYSPAYIITTSGSTGRPKGICHSHASAAAHITFMLDAYDIGRHDRISDIAPNHFDISTLALWAAPSVGATIVVVPEPYQMLPASLAQLTADEAISIWYSVPYLLTQLHARGNLDEHDLTALRWVLFGGEVFPPGMLAALMSRLDHARFSNVFGPAEVNACLVHHLDAPPRRPESAGDDAVIPAGRPFGDTTVRLVNPDDGSEPAPGEIGEMWVRGSTMMTGYWERDDLTAASVVTDADGRWYRTGDLGWQRDDGEFVFVGRLDHQVKVRGYRIHRYGRLCGGDGGSTRRRHRRGDRWCHHSRRWQVRRRPHPRRACGATPRLCHSDCAVSPTRSGATAGHRQRKIEPTNHSCRCGTHA